MYGSPFQLRNCWSHDRELVFTAKKNVQADVLGGGNNLVM